MKRILVLVLLLGTRMNAIERPIVVSAMADKQMADLGLKAEKLILLTTRALVSYPKLVVSLRNTSNRTYDRVSVTLTLLDPDGNEWSSQSVELKDVAPGSVTEVQARIHAHIKGATDKYRVTNVEVLTREPR